MLNFTSFRSARNTLAGIELRHMIRKGQMIVVEDNPMSFAEQFYCAGSISPPNFKGQRNYSARIYWVPLNAT